MTDDYYDHWVAEGLKLARLHDDAVFRRGAIAELERGVRDVGGPIPTTTEGLAIVTREASRGAMAAAGWASLAGRILQEGALNGRRTQAELLRGNEWLLEVARHSGLAWHSLGMAEQLIT